MIVADNEHVVMRPTLDEALAALVGDGGTVAGAEAAPAAPDDDADTDAAAAPVATVERGSDADFAAELANVQTIELGSLAATSEAAARAALSAGDWQTFGREMARLKAIIDALAARNAADADAIGTAAAEAGAQPARTPEPTP